MKKTFDFKQGDYDLRFSSGGICATLSAAWVQLMRDHKKIGINQRKLELEKVVRKSGPLLQKVYGKNFTGLNVLNDCKYLVRVAGGSNIEQSSIEDINGLVNGVTLKNYIASERISGVNLNFGWTDHSTHDEYAHCIAFWRSGKDTWHPSGHIYAFDPNIGEFKGDKNTFPSWFSNFLMPKYANSFNWTYYFQLSPMQNNPASKLGRRVM